MNPTPVRSCQTRHGSWNGLVRIPLAAWFFSATLCATPPAWWATRQVLSSGLGVGVDDYAAANLGQLKTLARKAALEMNAVLPGGAGGQINALITVWQGGPAAVVTRDDYVVLNVGQVKTVTRKFYDRLAMVGARPSGSYPWPPAPAATTDDYALVNVGQLKTLFSFDIPTFIDSDGDGISDAWEIANGLNPAVPSDALSDHDQDGISALDEYRFGLSPSANDMTTSGRTIQNDYDDLGRLNTVVRGTNETGYSNDAEGNLENLSQ